MKFDNRAAFSKVMGKNVQWHFFQTRCRAVGTRSKVVVARSCAVGESSEYD